jgi:hypothetical protein
MGLFKRKQEMSLDTLQLSLPEGFGPAEGSLTEIDIVGESNYQKHITAISELVGRDPFPIRLVPEPSNRYDPNAVAVFAGGACVGYIRRDTAEAWQKKALEARSRSEVLTGTAVIRTANGGMYGVFGKIHRPPNLAIVSSVEPAKATPAKIKRALESLEDAIDADPATKSQRKSQINKALKAGSLLYAHVASFDPSDEKQNPALVEVCRDFIIDIDAAADTPLESGVPEEVMNNFLDEWHYQTGSSRNE